MVVVEALKLSDQAVLHRAGQLGDLLVGLGLGAFGLLCCAAQALHLAFDPLLFFLGADGLLAESDDGVGVLACQELI